MSRRVNLGNLFYLPQAEDFLEDYDFPKELVEDVVRAPQRIELDPRTAEAGYPIYRMVRGDIIVVIGAKNPDQPAIMYVFLNFPGYVQRNQRKTSGGSGPSKPHTHRDLRSWLQHIGAEMEIGGTGHTKVYYHDVYIGSISNTPSENKNSTENAYSHLSKKITAVLANEEVSRWNQTRSSDQSSD